MELWKPEPDEPVLLAWWDPLLRASDRAFHDRVPWPIRIQEFRLLGRLDRGRHRPAIWIYQHEETGRELCADAHGRTYEFRAFSTGAPGGRFTEVDVRRAVFAAGLHTLPRHAEPDAWRVDDPLEELEEEWHPAPGPAAPEREPRPSPRRRRPRPPYLRLVTSDRSA